MRRNKSDVGRVRVLGFLSVSVDRLDGVRTMDHCAGNDIANVHATWKNAGVELVDCTVSCSFVLW